VNEPTPTRAGDALDWLHEQGKRRASTVPNFDPDETLGRVRAARGADAYALSHSSIASSFAAGLPHHRAIVALDIERSTSWPSPVQGELRNKVYELFEAALRAAGIDRHHRDQFIDRGDGILALIHPVDQAPKTLLLNRVIPSLSRLLTEYNASLPRHSQQQRELRVRVVMHAGEVHYDANGCFGEALDVAFRLLDAARVKQVLRATADPLVLVVSGEIYSTIVRQGYGDIDRGGFHQRVRVQVGGKRYPGWIHIPEHVTTQIADLRRPS